MKLALHGLDQGDDDLIVVHDALEFGECHLAIGVSYIFFKTNSRFNLMLKALIIALIAMCRSQHMEYLQMFHLWLNWQQCHIGLLKGLYGSSQATHTWVTLQNSVQMIYIKMIFGFDQT